MPPLEEINYSGEIKEIINFCTCDVQKSNISRKKLNTKSKSRSKYWISDSSDSDENSISDTKTKNMTLEQYFSLPLKPKRKRIKLESGRLTDLHLF